MKPKSMLLSLVTVLLVTVLIAGCGGGVNVKRLTGLSASDVVKTFIDNAKNNKLDEAGLYVSPASKNDPQTVLKYLTGQTGQSELDLIKNSNLIAAKQVAQQGNYAVVLTTLQEQNTFNVIIRPLGLEKINGEWYIVDFNQIYNDTKYSILQSLLQNI